MVVGMVCRAINERVRGEVFAVVDHDGPELDEGEEEKVGEFMKREDEGEEVIGYGLHHSQTCLEGGRGRWGGGGKGEQRRGGGGGGGGGGRRGWEQSIDGEICGMFYTPMDDGVLDES